MSLAILIALAAAAHQCDTSEAARVLPDSSQGHIESAHQYPVLSDADAAAQRLCEQLKLEDCNLKSRDNILGLAQAAWASAPVKPSNTYAMSQESLSGSSMCAALSNIIACKVDQQCTFEGVDAHHHDHSHDYTHDNEHSHGHEHHHHHHHHHRKLKQVGGDVTLNMKLMAAGVLFVEALVGMYVPVLLKGAALHQWYLSLLNCFSGGVFVAAGLIHLLPHCAEAQEQLGPVGHGHYPTYLLLVVLGYLLVFFVERVLFDVHGEGHSHCQHSNIFNYSNYYREKLSALQHQHDHDHDQACDHAHDDGHEHGSDGHVHMPSCSAGCAHSHSDGHSHGQGVSEDGGASGVKEVSPPRLVTLEGSGVREPLLAQDAQLRPRFEFMHGAVLLLAMVLHTFLEAMALGFMDDRGSFYALLAAIVSHKAISALALTARFLKEGASVRQVTLYVGPFTFVAPSAILVGALVGHIHPAAHLVLSCLATGTFLYVGASEVIVEEFEGEVRSGRTDISHRTARYVKFGTVLLAVAAVAACAALPEPEHDHP